MPNPTPLTKAAKDFAAQLAHLDDYLIGLNKWAHDVEAIMVKIDWTKVQAAYPKGSGATNPPPPPNWP